MNSYVLSSSNSMLNFTHYSSTQSLARKKLSKSHQNATTTSSLTIKSQIVILWRRGQKSKNRKFNHRYYTNAKTRRAPEINLRILHTAKRIPNLCFRFLYFVLCYYTATIYQYTIISASSFFVNLVHILSFE